jgi:hypothetical protein
MVFSFSYEMVVVYLFLFFILFEVFYLLIYYFLFILVFYKFLRTSAEVGGYRGKRRCLLIV